MDTSDIDAAVVVQLVAYLGAINWLLLETANTDLAVEVLGSSSSGIAYVAVGAAGVVAATEQLGLTEIFDEDA